MSEQKREPSAQPNAPEIQHPQITEIEHTTAHPDNPQVNNQANEAER
jgi:hypothetical protein